MALTLDEMEEQVDALYGIIHLRAQIEALQKRERDAVLVARAKGCSWQQVGNALSMSRQAAWERYRT